MSSQIAIVGSRRFSNNRSNFRRAEKFVKSNIDIDNIDRIISGGADGADSIAEDFANKYDVEFIEILPEFKVKEDRDYRVQDFFERNTEIAKLCDTMFVFWDQESSGTDDVRSKAIKFGKTVYTWDFKQKKELDVKNK
jgi:predicted Rossmann fold nucleotide-binding protein DprA/Smf involved in DNA uptake